MNTINGQAIALNIQERIKREIAEARLKTPPCLVMIIVGDHPASRIYVARKSAACATVGITSRVLEFPESLNEQALLHEIAKLNEDPIVNGILVQLPLPKQISTQKVIETIDPQKDVDGFHPINQGYLLAGLDGGFVPCTPLGVQVLLSESGVDLSGKHVVIVGRSNIVGKPLAALLMQNKPGANATVTIAHSKTENLHALCKSADVLVAALGRPRYIQADMVKPGAVVIDVGINRVDGKLCGDVDFEEVKKLASLITPVPGGVGPMTIAMLLSNTWKSYNKL